MGARMLIVEDDARIRLALQMVLEDEGHVVELAESAEAGLEAIARRQPDVVLVDLMLPGMDGFELCRRLRARSDVPILILTARSDSHDVVAGLEAGADDYVVKPAVPKELSARVRALLRRTTRSEPGPVNPRFGDIEVVPDAGTVRVAGVDVSLTKTEFKLLCELAQNPGRLLTREVLLDRVWGYGYFGDGRLVDVHVRRLRTKVEKDPTHPRHIVTVRGLGYKLEP
ncbi:MAG TPA: response regulator transcription factor [Acidimicrobiales bacterium]|nr:response regulator transcription factor [Acidimicrobiales bacterium]